MNAAINLPVPHFSQKQNHIIRDTRNQHIYQFFVPQVTIFMKSHVLAFLLPDVGAGGGYRNDTRPSECA